VVEILKMGTGNMVFKSRKKEQSKNIWREGKKTVEEGE
jgi:hypothetical protein